MYEDELHLKDEDEKDPLDISEDNLGEGGILSDDALFDDLDDPLEDDVLADVEFKDDDDDSFEKKEKFSDEDY
ncbi:MAG: hypothetical protein WDK96_03455 [Candidatus Paceibacterota bacterium]|jgi:hypothetical protein